MKNQEVLERLKKGHAQFLAESPMPVSSMDRVRDLAQNGQHPFAVVVTCSDSRVAPEILFHCQLGDIFTIRTAGHVISDVELGSIEYAVDHLGVRFVLVLGHAHCGAVQSACALHGECSHSLSVLLGEITPSVEAARCECGESSEMVARAEELNIDRSMAAIGAHPVLSGIENLEIWGAKYDIDTGNIEGWHKLEG